MKKIIIIVVVALLLVGGGVGGYLMLSGEDAGSEEGAADVANAEPVVVESDPIYLPLDPAFVVNFEQQGNIRYLQLSLQIMSYHEEVVEKVSANIPAVRNSLIMLFSGQDYDQLNTSEGKENLRQLVLQSINGVVKLNGEKKVDDVYFTGFVMQ